MLIAVINPISGGGRARRMAEHFFQRSSLILKQLGMGQVAGSFPRIETDAEGVWRRRLSEKLHEAGGPQLILAFGGDGTLSQTACTVHDAGLMEASTLFLVPGGRGNDFTRTLYGRTFLEDEFWVWVASKKWTSRPVDLAVCNGMKFLNMASVGYGGKVVENVHNRKAFWSKTAAVYQVEGALALFGEKNTHGVIHSVDNLGTTETLYDGDVFGAFVGNGSANGSGLFWTPKAVTDDGKLDAVVFRKPSFLEMLKTLNEVKRARDPRISHRRGVASSFVFEFREPVAIELDGEYRGRADKIQFSTILNALRALA